MQKIETSARKARWSVFSSRQIRRYPCPKMDLDSENSSNRPKHEQRGLPNKTSYHQTRSSHHIEPRRRNHFDGDSRDVSWSVPIAALRNSSDVLQGALRWEV